MEDRPKHPKYGDPLSGSTQWVDGVPFYPYRRGIGTYIRVSHDGRIAIYNSGRIGSTFTCLVDDKPLPKKFRKFETAAKAGREALS